MPEYGEILHFILYLSVIFTLDSRHRFYLYQIKIARITQKTCTCTSIPLYKNIVKVLRLILKWILFSPSILFWIISYVRMENFHNQKNALRHEFCIKKTSTTICRQHPELPRSFQLWTNFPTFPIKPFTTQVPFFTSLYRFWTTLVLLP